MTERDVGYYEGIEDARKGFANGCTSGDDDYARGYRAGYVAACDWITVKENNS